MLLEKGRVEGSARTQSWIVAKFRADRGFRTATKFRAGCGFESLQSFTLTLVLRLL